MNLTSTDCLITLVYFAVVLGIGYVLIGRVKTSKEFFAAGRELPAWVCGLAFASASLGAQEVMGLGAAGARYGLAAASWFSLGAVPAMLFAGLFMMPLYYGSKARTTPEFLGLRFDEKTRTLNAGLFAVTAIFGTGISLALMARIIQALHIFDGLFRAMDWPLKGIFVFSVAVPAVVVLGYILLGGLRGAVYNQVLQFVVLVAGLLPVVLMGLKQTGGWSGLMATAALHPTANSSHSAAHLAAIGLLLGIVLGAGTWCTDFRILQIAMAAKTMEAARRTPMLAAVPRLLVAVLLIVPGLVAISLPTPRTTTVIREENGAIVHETTVARPEAELGQGLVPARTDPATGRPMTDPDGHPLLDYAMATPNLLLRVLPSGLLGLGLTALLAALMSGIAAGVTAFSAVFTGDLYQAHMRQDADDGHLLKAGRWTAVSGMALSVATAYAAFRFNNLMGALLLIFALVNAPVLATFLLGMFWKRATGHGAFAGLIAGTGAALLHHGLTLCDAARAGLHGGWIGVLHTYPGKLAQAFWTVVFALCANLLVTVTVSVCTEARPETELAGLVHWLTPRPEWARVAWWKRPETLAVGILLAALLVLVAIPA